MVQFRKPKRKKKVRKLKADDLLGISPDSDMLDERSVHGEVVKMGVHLFFLDYAHFCEFCVPVYIISKKTVKGVLFIWPQDQASISHCLMLVSKTKKNKSCEMRYMKMHPQRRLWSACQIDYPPLCDTCETLVGAEITHGHKCNVPHNASQELHRGACSHYVGKALSVY